jgi:hypothetical protein
MPYSRIYFCTNAKLMSTSCFSVRLSVERVTNFRRIFSATTHYRLDILEVLFRGGVVCQMVGFIFVRILCQLPVFPCVCP